MDPTDKARVQTQRTGACHSVGNRSSGGLRSLFHRGIKHFAPLTLNELHNAFFNTH